MRIAYVVFANICILQSQLTKLIVMVAETVSLGVLSLPATVATMGLVPCVLPFRYQYFIAN